MNKQNKAQVNPLLQAGLFVAFIIVALGITFRSSLVFSLSNGAGDLQSIKTALAGTAQALLGPFPTQTMPTKTASSTPTNTPLISATPTFTPSKTFTPIPTRTLLGTATLPEHSVRLTQTAVATLNPFKTPTRIATRTPTRVSTRTPTKAPTLIVNQTTPTRGKTPTPVPTNTRRPTRTPIPPTSIPPTPIPPTNPPPTTYP